MPIITISRDWGVVPSLVRITATDDLTTITTPNYLLTQDSAIRSLNNGEFEWLDNDGVVISYLGGINTFRRDVPTNTFVLMNEPAGGEIVTPTIPGHIIIAFDSIGTIGNQMTDVGSTANFNGNIQAGNATFSASGTISSFNATGETGTLTLEAIDNVGGATLTISNVSQEQSATVLIPDIGSALSTFIMSNTANGTQQITSGNLQLDAGSVTVVGGELIATVSAPNSGSLRLIPTDPGGDFDVKIQNQLMTQNSTYIIPNIHQSFGAFVVAQEPLLMKQVNTLELAGGAVVFLVNDPFCTTTSNVKLSFRSFTNFAMVGRITPADGSFEFTTDVDPGASVIDYIIVNPQAF